MYDKLFTTQYSIRYIQLPNAYVTMLYVTARNSKKYGVALVNVTVR